jgi:1-acyl-sn-glycerol-3-phosphate acyltransferase
MIVLRSALFYLLSSAGTLVIAVAALPLLVLPWRWVLPVLRLWAGMVLLLLRRVAGIGLRVTGAEHLPRKGAALVAAKHQSAFDTVVWLWLLPDTVYVLKRELLRVPLWGWIAARGRMIPVDRSGGAAAMRKLLRAGQEAAAEGRQIVIFPEGTRVPPGEWLPFQPGIAALAAATGLPVLPVATDSGVFWGRKAFRKRPGTITVAVLPPLPAGLRRDALLRQLEAVIATETNRLLAAGPVDESVD